MFFLCRWCSFLVDQIGYFCFSSLAMSVSNDAVGSVYQFVKSCIRDKETKFCLCEFLCDFFVVALTHILFFCVCS